MGRRGESTSPEGWTSARRARKSPRAHAAAHGGPQGGEPAGTPAGGGRSARPYWASATKIMAAAFRISSVIDNQSRSTFGCIARGYSDKRRSPVKKNLRRWCTASSTGRGRCLITCVGDDDRRRDGRRRLGPFGGRPAKAGRAGVPRERPDAAGIGDAERAPHEQGERVGRHGVTPIAGRADDRDVRRRSPSHAGRWPGGSAHVATRARTARRRSPEAGSEAG